MPYNMTFFPNMMEHYDQDIAASNMEVSSHNITHTYHFVDILYCVNIGFAGHKPTNLQSFFSEIGSIKQSV